MLTLLATLFVLGVLILVHELGHFLAAKSVGVAVPRFSVGLGPRVWGIRRGETEYVISALPLGGYVRMAGAVEDEQAALEGGRVEEVPPERRFESKPLWARVWVISAGVCMNALFAWLAFSVLVLHQGRRPPVVAEVVPGTPAAAAGLLPGDSVVAVGGESVRDWAEFAAYTRAHPGDTVRVLVARGSARLELAVVAAAVRERDVVSGDTLLVGQIGVLGGERVPVGPGYALVEGGRRTVALTGDVLRFLGHLVVGRASPREVAGVITIGKLSGEFARMGWAQLVWLMAFLSVNLAIVNLLPIPILDGGHLVFLALEAVRGRALSLEVRARLTQVGLVVLVALMVWALTADVLRLLGR